MVAKLKMSMLELLAFPFTLSAGVLHQVKLPVVLFGFCHIL